MSSTLKIIETSNSTIFFDNLTLFHQTSPLRNKHQYNHTLPPSRQSPAKASLSYYVHCKTITLFHYALKKRKKSSPCRFNLDITVYHPHSKHTVAAAELC